MRNIDFQSVRSAGVDDSAGTKARAFSAKGAAFNKAWGNAPGFRKSQASALKARLMAVDMHMPMNRAFSARAFGGHQFLGRRPRLKVR